MARGAYDASMIYCYLTDCYCSANYKHAQGNTNVAVPPKKAEVHPTKIPQFKREDACLSDNKENIPPTNDKEADPQHDLGKKEG